MPLLELLPHLAESQLVQRKVVVFTFMLQFQDRQGVPSDRGPVATFVIDAQDAGPHMRVIRLAFDHFIVNGIRLAEIALLFINRRDDKFDRLVFAFQVQVFAVFTNRVAVLFPAQVYSGAQQVLPRPGLLDNVLHFRVQLQRVLEAAGGLV